MHRQRSLPTPLSRARVCRSRSGLLRAETPPSHHDHGLGIPCVLVLIGKWEAVLGPRRFTGQNKHACEIVGLLATSFKPQQPFSSRPIHDSGEIPGANHAIKKKHWSADASDCLDHSFTPQLAANRISDLPRHSSPATRNPARKTNRSFRCFCYSRLSSCTAQTSCLSQPAKPAWGICCADQIGFACQEFRKQSA